MYTEVKIVWKSFKTAFNGNNILIIKKKTMLSINKELELYTGQENCHIVKNSL